MSSKDGIFCLPNLERGYLQVVLLDRILGEQVLSSANEISECIWRHYNKSADQTESEQQLNDNESDFESVFQEEKLGFPKSNVKTKVLKKI